MEASHIFIIRASSGFLMFAKCILQIFSSMCFNLYNGQQKTRHCMQMKHFRTVKRGSLRLRWLLLNLVMLKADFKIFSKYFHETVSTYLGITSGLL